MNKELIDKLFPIVETLQAYHRHKVIGLEHVPEEGSALIVCNHSLATYDMGLLQMEIFKCKDRFTRSLIDRLFYKIPLLGELMEAMGSVKGTRGATSTTTHRSSSVVGSW